MAGFRKVSRGLSKRLAIALPATHLLLAACTTYQPLDPDALSRIDVVLKPGDDVRILTRSGEQIDLTITSIEADAIAAEDRRVALSDVQAVEARTLNKRRVWIIAGAVAGALLLSVDYDDGDCNECFPVFP